MDLQGLYKNCDLWFSRRGGTYETQGVKEYASSSVMLQNTSGVKDLLLFFKLWQIYITKFTILTIFKRTAQWH